MATQFQLSTYTPTRSAVNLLLAINISKCMFEQQRYTEYNYEVFEAVGLDLTDTFEFLDKF